MRRFLLLSAALTILASCAQEEPGVDFNLSSLTMTGLPSDVSCLGFLVYPVANTADVMEFQEPVDAGQVVLGSGRLPAAGTSFEIAVNGYRDACPANSAPAYRGTSGIISIAAGERRVVDITFYAVDSAMTNVDLSDVRTQGAPMMAPRFLHTASVLRDGRVLIAGGFVQLQATSCPPGRVGYTCYAASAAGDAYLFHPASGELYRVEGGMLVPRAGHTATVLRDGRVIMAGGAERAILGFRDVPGVDDNPRDLDMFIEGMNVSDSYEVFSPTPEAPSADPQRRGFPEQGRFTNAAGEGRMGSIAPALDTLTAPRFLHAAARLERSVLFAGGSAGDGASSSDQTYEVYTVEDEGAITREGDALLKGSYPEASALTVGEQIWIAGRITQGSTDLPPFELWTRPSGGGAGGTVEIMGNAQYGYRRPLLAASAPTAPERFVLVMGWFGPTCDAQGDLDNMGIRCAPDQPENTVFRRGVSANDSPFEGFAERRHAYGSAVTLPNNVSLFLGGFTEGFTTANDVSGFATNSPSLSPSTFSNLVEGRAFHTTSLIPSGTGTILLTVGGISGDMDGLTLNDSVEYIVVP